MARVYKTKRKKDNNRRINKRMVIGGLSIFVLVILISSFVLGGGWSSINNLKESGGFRTSEFGEILGVNEEKEKPWWNDDFPYSVQLTIVNQDSFNSLSMGDVVESNINHKVLIEEGKSLENGNDLVLLYFNKEKDDFEELSFELVDPNTENTKLRFQLPLDIDPYENTKEFCLFYGNMEFMNDKFSPINETSTAVNTDYVINVGAEMQNPVYGITNRMWVLKGADNFPDYSELIYTVELKDDINPISTPTYEIIGTEEKGKLERIGDSDNYEAHIKMDTLSAGSYQIRAKATNSNGLEQSSPKSDFIVSAPLYVAWTIDWEGYDTSNATLKSMDDFSAKYDTPMTHFWNPRSNIALNKERNEYLLNWVKNRESNNGDEIGLHLHMYYDMVKAAGIQPQYDPQWANRGTGSDVPMYIYSYDEQLKMLEWAKAEFAKVGLSQPKSFRTGGWMSNMDTLKALEASGFLFDSSARTQYSFGEYKVEDIPEQLEVPEVTPIDNIEAGNLYETTEEVKPQSTLRNPTPEEVDHYLKYIEDRNYVKTGVNGEIIPLANFVSYKVEGKWNVSTTAKPYQPSTTDINSSNGTKMNLWEFPNNGADSWHFGKEVLVQRFKDNYNEAPIDEPQVVTYLTHPHAINVDIPKLEATYDVIGVHKAANDSGPVIYVTLEEAYEDISGLEYN